MNHYRQGDVLAVEVKSIPSRARELPRDKHNRIVLAEGEKTGHAHTIKDKGVCSFTTLDNADIEFMLVGGGGASLNHELVSGARAEHTKIALPEGKYELAQQVEYMPKELIRVAD